MPDSNEKSEVDGEIDAHSRSELAYLLHVSIPRWIPFTDSFSVV